MNSSSAEKPASSYIGHVKSGVIVLDDPFPLAEGQAVRTEPIPQYVGVPITDDLAAQLERMKALFAQWDEEDSQLSDEEADRLQVALEENRGLSFREVRLIPRSGPSGTC